MMLDIMNQIKEKKWFAVILLVLLVVLGVCAFRSHSSNTSSLDTVLASSEVSNTELPLATSVDKEQVTSVQVESEEVVVDVKGAVKKEGIYHLSKGKRISDAILAAGGFLDTADKKSVNLAQKVTDEGVIYVASQGEGISVIRPSDNSSSQITQASTGKVNINTASLSELQTISGIGAKRAQDIIDYREANGGFKSIEDLKHVSGIGEKTLEKLKELVTLG